MGTRAKNRAVLEDELNGILEWAKKERENGVDFSKINTLHWDKVKKLARASEISKQLEEINAAENKAKISTQRNEVSKIRQEILSAHSNSCDVCLMDNIAILEVHHIVSVENNGSNEYENLAVLCPNCHAMIHKMSNSFARNESSLIDKWISENYSAGAKDRLLKLFLDNIRFT